ncbi:MAG: nucleotidyltransferase domain-containing protein [Phycisphaeraceae bacterium]|nr:nucleotidyltransferase domain-containing protein [Phycisphaeraceae bacterium]MBX3405411.1 nucleotidyltransferase domain-containing protein [Phycisphaeraceae bacterium]
MLLNGVEFDLRTIERLCRKAGVQRLWLTGSILTSEFRPDSDIDLLVETDPRQPVGLLALGGLQMDLSDLLGRPVHLTLLGGVPTSDRPRVLSQARLLDAA